MSDYRVDAQVNFDEMNNRVRFEIRRTVNALTLRLQRIVQEDMLSGQRLKVQSGRLRGSVSSKVDEDKIPLREPWSWWCFAPYAPAHEFGLNGALGVKAHLRTIKQAFGRPISPVQVNVKAHSRNVRFRELRFMRDSLDIVAKIVPKILMQQFSEV